MVYSIRASGLQPHIIAWYYSQELILLVCRYNNNKGKKSFVLTGHNGEMNAPKQLWFPLLRNGKLKPCVDQHFIPASYSKKQITDKTTEQRLFARTARPTSGNSSGAFARWAAVAGGASINTAVLRNLLEVFHILHCFFYLRIHSYPAAVPRWRHDPLLADKVHKTNMKLNRKKNAASGPTLVTYSTWFPHKTFKRQ